MQLLQLSHLPLIFADCAKQLATSGRLQQQTLPEVSASSCWQLTQYVAPAFTAAEPCDSKSSVAGVQVPSDHGSITAQQNSGVRDAAASRPGAGAAATVVLAAAVILLLHTVTWLPDWFRHMLYGEYCKHVGIYSVWACRLLLTT